MGTWQKVPVVEQAALEDSATSFSVNLPRANRIGGLQIVLEGTGGAGTPAIEGLITRIETTANGSSSVVDCTNQQIRDIMQMKAGGIRADEVNASGALSYCVTDILFGRHKHDKEVILPADLFKTLQLKVSFGTLIASTAFATGTAKISVYVDEYIEDEEDPEEYKDEDLFIQKITQIETFTSAAAGVKKIELPIGNYIASLYLRAAGTDGTTIPKFRIQINNGEHFPLSDSWLNSQSGDKVEYCLVGGSGASKIANVTMADFDNPATEQIMDEVIDTTPGSGIRSADVLLTQGAASQACSVVQIEYVDIAAD